MTTATGTAAGQTADPNAAANAAAAAASTEAATLTPEQLAQEEKDAEAAFQAGADGAHSEGMTRQLKPVAKKDDKATETQTDTATDAATGETPAADAADVEQPVFAGLKESELKAMFSTVGELREHGIKTEKEVRKAFGKLGDIQAQLTAANTGLGKREIPAEALKKFKDEYPDMAELLEPLLHGMPAPAAGGFTKEQVDASVKEAVTAVRQEVKAEVRRELQIEMLQDRHEDWQNYTQDGPGKTDINLWLGTQSAEYREKFLNTNSPTFIAGALDKFKAWKDQDKPHRQSNNRRLASAITPTNGAGKGASTLISDDDAFTLAERQQKAARSGSG